MSPIAAPHATSAPAPVPLETAIEGACRRVPPLWTLRNFVAVNAYLGYSDQRFHDAVDEVDRVFHARGFWPLAEYRARYEAGRIRDEDLEVARREAADWLDRPELVAEDGPARREVLLAGAPSPDGPGAERVRTYAEATDRARGQRFAPLVVDEISKWCAARFDAGQAAWAMPWAERPLFAAWREAALVDRSPELRGLRGFRACVRALPEKPVDAIAAVLQRLSVPPEHHEAFLARALASIAGWAGHVQYRVRQAALEGRSDDSLVQLLAVRLAFEAGVHHALGARPLTAEEWSFGPAVGADAASGSAALSAREIAFVWQLALEAGYRRTLVSQLARRPAAAPEGRPALQAVFCIDVRSEVLRRHLEAVSPRIRTLGFAGFFGFPIESVRPGDARGAARCPVLIAPSHRVLEHTAGRPDVEARFAREEEHHRTFKALRLSTVTAFPFVETLGSLFGLRLASDSLGWTRPDRDGRLFPPSAERALAPDIEPAGDGAEATGLDRDARVALAEGALRNMGLLDDFAEVVLVCGHGSVTTNNPHASGLDCGACGGHAGDVNARVAAAVLEDPEVRRALAARGIRIPDDTRFVPALHETTTDTVELLDPAALSAGQRATLQGWLDEAGNRARAEREQRLRPAPEDDVPGAARRRSRDWSEVRPEWGLVRNAAFVAAPRARTRGLDLDGRVFLHDYDAALDPDGRVLDLILSAPLVVASWINLQYYASTVDNDVFGSGNKVLHNVVGRHGVMLGNRSDLRPGLPWQSVHDGVDFVHEPLRLLAVVEAPRARIERVLDAHPEVAELVANGWLQLLAIEPADGSFHRFVRGGFEPFAGASGGSARAAA